MNRIGKEVGDTRRQTTREILVEKQLQNETRRPMRTANSNTAGKSSGSSSG
jgi:hypothetical protein